MGMCRPLCPVPAAYKTERVLRVVSSLDFRYERGARDVVTFLRLVPPAARGRQRLVRSTVHAAPLPHRSETRPDAFGNAVRELRHERVAEHLTLVVDFTVQNSAWYDAGDHLVPAPILTTDHLPAGGLDAFRAPTALSAPNATLENVAAVLRAETLGDDPLALPFALSRRVYQEMTFGAGATSVRTTAAEAWAMKKGVCQDYAHVLIALCRALQIPARYVSGFLPGEGVTHAWVEVWLPGPDEGWFAIDPTHDRWVGERYVSVAVGRDYHDVMPNHGTYFGGPSVLSPHSRITIARTVKTPL